MKIVIELDDTFYDILCLGKKAKKTKLTDGAVDILFKAVLNGTPLPKGHGRLIDEEDIALIDEQFYVPSDYYVAESAINDAPTIIEAKGSESK